MSEYDRQKDIEAEGQRASKTAMILTFPPDGLNREKLKKDLNKLHTMIYEDNCVGCCLHIVLDDQNYDRESIKFCLNESVKKGHMICGLMCVGLSFLTDKDLEFLQENPGCYEELP